MAEKQSFKISKGLIVLGVIVGLIIGTFVRPSIQYTGTNVPLAYILTGQINTEKTYNFALEMQDTLRKKSKQLMGTYEVYQQYDLSTIDQQIKQDKEQLYKYESGQEKGTKKNIIALENEIEYLNVLKDYLARVSEAEFAHRINEDIDQVLILEKYAFNALHTYVNAKVDMTSKREELTALDNQIKNANEEEVKQLKNQRKELESEIVEVEQNASGIKGYKSLIKRENTVLSLISERNCEQSSMKVTNFEDWIKKVIQHSRLNYLITLILTIGLIILLAFIGHTINNNTSYKKKHQLKLWKDNHFERGDSFTKIIITYIILLVMCLIAFYPLLNVFSISLRPGNNLFATDLRIIPLDATWDNFREAIFDIDLGIWLKNSLIVALITSVLGVIFSASAGYAFSRFKFTGRKPGMMIFLITQMFPAPMLLLPTYILISKLQLTDQLLGLLIPYVASAVPFAVWLLKGYFDTIPRSLEESAYVDGCSPMYTFIKIIIPLAKPALAIATLFAFMTAWSEYVVAKIIVNSKSVITLPVGLVTLQGEFQTKWGVYSAAALITSIPVIIVFICLSKYLVSGLTLGSVKE